MELIPFPIVPLPLVPVLVVVLEAVFFETTFAVARPTEGIPALVVVLVAVLILVLPPPAVVPDDLTFTVELVLLIVLPVGAAEAFFMRV